MDVNCHMEQQDLSQSEKEKSMYPLANDEDNSILSFSFDEELTPNLGFDEEDIWQEISSLEKVNPE